MSRKTTTQILEPERVGATEREHVIDELYAIHSDIFDGVSRPDFVRYVFDSPATSTRIAVYRDPDQRAVGYVAMHFFEFELEEDRCVVVRIESGMSRSHRSGALSAGFVAQTFLRYVARHPRRRFYFFACPIHPSSYTAVARRMPRYWPRHDRPTPAATLMLMSRMAEAFELQAPNPKKALVRRVGWITRDSDVERAYWRTCEKPEARFYVQENPGYGHGDGLLLLVELDPTSVTKALSQLLIEQTKSRLRHIAGQLDQRTKGRALPFDECVRVLESVPLFAGLDREARALLAKNARTVRVSPGRWVFHQRDRGDAMYVLTRGSAYVLHEPEVGHGTEPAEPIVLDQLGVGEVFGEMALVTGQPRNAGVRAATFLTLLRVDTESVQAAARIHPASAARLWQNVAKYRFDIHVRDVPELCELTRADRLAWFDASHELAWNRAPWQTTPWRGPPSSHGAGRGWLFLYQGTAGVLSDRGRWSVSAPCLIPLDAIDSVEPSPGARARNVPPVSVAFAPLLCDVETPRHAPPED